MDDIKIQNISIKWLRFLINWRLPLGIIFNSAIFNNLIHILPKNELFSIGFEIFYALIALVFPIITLSYCIQQKKIGYYLLKISLVVEIVFNSATGSISAFPPHSGNQILYFFITFASTVLIFSFAWIFPNFIYLKKRKHLFVSKEKIKSKIKKENTNKITDNNKNNLEKQKKYNLQKKTIKSESKKDEFTFSISKKKLIIIIVSLIIVVLICLGIYFLIDYIDSLKDEILSYKRKYNTVNNKYTSLQSDYSSMKTKIDFYDEHIVFVLEGYGNYYYTYDQVQQVTQGNEYDAWAFNEEAAIDKGYKAFPQQSVWEKYKKERQNK